METKSGVCSDKAALLEVMLRSQGVPATYISGLFEFEGVLLSHAWVMFKEQGNQFWQNCDPTYATDSIDYRYAATYSK